MSKNYIYINGKRIDISEETIRNIVKGLEPEERKFYGGEKFKCILGGAEYILAFIGNYTTLIHTKYGITKNGLYKRTKRYFDLTKQRTYVTTLPTCFPEDFGLDKKYGGYDE